MKIYSVWRIHACSSCQDHFFFDPSATSCAYHTPRDQEWQSAQGTNCHSIVIHLIFLLLSWFCYIEIITPWNFLPIFFQTRSGPLSLYINLFVSFLGIPHIHACPSWTDRPTLKLLYVLEQLHTVCVCNTTQYPLLNPTFGWQPWGRDDKCGGGGVKQNGWQLLKVFNVIAFFPSRGSMSPWNETTSQNLAS